MGLTVEVVTDVEIDGRGDLVVTRKCLLFSEGESTIQIKPAGQITIPLFKERRHGRNDSPARLRSGGHDGAKAGERP